MVQDLRIINEGVIPIHPLVADPYTLLSQIPGDTQLYSVLKLKDAFFSVPLHPDSQFIFAFEWNDRYTREKQLYMPGN